jgi:hypothetical protein
MSWVEEQSWFGLEDLVVEARQNYLENLNSNLWETRDGDTINISDMSESHIRHCINKILRDNWRMDYLPLLKAELNKRRRRK